MATLPEGALFVLIVGLYLRGSEPVGSHNAARTFDLPFTVCHPDVQGIGEGDLQCKVPVGFQFGRSLHHVKRHEIINYYTL